MITPPALRPAFLAAPAAQPLWHQQGDLSASWRAADGTPVHLRPLRQKELEGLDAFGGRLSDRCLAAHATIRAPLAAAAESSVSLVLTVPDEGGERVIGEARFVVHDNTSSAEITMVVADAWQRHGIGTQTTLALVRIASSRGLRWLRAEVAADNRSALSLLRHCGFTRAWHPDASERVQLQLMLLPPFPAQPAPPWSHQGLS